jgi:hypothetical protein
MAHCKLVIQWCSIYQRPQVCVYVNNTTRDLLGRTQDRELWLKSLIHVGVVPLGWSQRRELGIL